MLKHLLPLCLAAGLLLSGCGAARGADVSGLMDEGRRLYESGNYADSLEQYLTAMEQNPKDMDARMGAASCQIALGRYAMARTTLDSAADVDPADEMLYQMYLYLGQVTGDFGPARAAAELAAQYNPDYCRDNMPAAPEFSMESGSYTAPQTLELTCSDPDAQIYYQIQRSEDGIFSGAMPYTRSLPLVLGETQVSAFTVKDGAASPSVTLTCSCEYAPTPAVFLDPVVEENVCALLDNDDPTDADLIGVTSLSLSAYDEEGRVSTLADLNQLPMLQSLSLYDQTKLNDYSALAACPLLSQLTLYSSNLGSLDLVQNCPGVQSLQVPYNSITDLSPVTGLTNLTTLDIRLNPIADMTPLTQLTDLNTLGLDSSQLTALPDLSFLSDLKSLTLQGWDGADLSRLSALSSLTSLSIGFPYSYSYDNPPTLNDLSFLASMPDLNYLSLVGVSDPAVLGQISQCTNLTTLYLYNCPATGDAAALQALQQALPNCAIYW